MKHPFQHIAFLLLAVFTVTFVPFNAFHHHAEDEHAAFVHSHKTDVQHHCELDNHFCQTDLDSNCGHESHIQNEIEKCFACEFHFIEDFDTTCSIELSAQETTRVMTNTFMSGKLRQAVIRISNKGPPLLV